MNSKSKRRKSENTELSFPALLGKCGIFIPIFCIVALICTVIVSLIFFGTDDPTSKIEIAGLISLYVSVFVCSLVLAKSVGQKQLLCGIIYGVFIFLLTYLISLFLGKSENAAQSFIFRLIIIAVSVVASLLARKRNTRKIKHKRLG